VIAERLMQPSNSWATIETNRKVHEAQPLQDLIEKAQNPSQHVKVQLGDLKACRACAVAGRRSKQTQKRRPLEELSRNTLRGTAQANAGRADRPDGDARRSGRDNLYSTQSLPHTIVPVFTPKVLLPL